MATYVFRQRNSTGARNLAAAIGGRRVHQLPQLGRNDHVICWGEAAAGGANFLNGAPIRSKYQDAIALKRAGVPTIEVAERLPNRVHDNGRFAPRVEQVEAPIKLGANVQDIFHDAFECAMEFVENDAPNFESPVFQKGISDLEALFGKLKGSLGKKPEIKAPVRIAPVAPVVDGIWLARKNNHVGGKDLLRPPAEPDFYAKKEDIIEEFRVHSFLGKSIRTGKKVLREDFVGRASDWIRSWDGGWKIVYDGVKGRNDQRNLAHLAVRTLGLDFAAVDIGKLRNGNLIVLECNRAPGIEGGTIERYANAIMKWRDE